MYEECSRQKINKEKSAIMFSKNTNSTVRSDIKHVIGLHTEMEHEKCLGLYSTSVDPRKKLSNISMTEYGIEFKAGRRNCCHKRGKRP